MRAKKMDHLLASNEDMRTDTEGLLILALMLSMYSHLPELLINHTFLFEYSHWIVGC
jgi:hypothetical protein